MGTFFIWFLCDFFVILHPFGAGFRFCKFKHNLKNGKIKQKKAGEQRKMEKCSNKDKPWVSHREKWSFKHRFTLFFFFWLVVCECVPSPALECMFASWLLFGFRAHSFLLSVTRKKLHAIWNDWEYAWVKPSSKHQISMTKSPMNS